MKKLFIHHPLFRLLSPLFSGTMVYLLILLINNNIEQLQDAFLGQELYVCIGLAYLIQEYARISLLLFKWLKRPKSFVLKLLLQIVVSVLLCIFLVTVAMYLYFSYVLGYTPNSAELIIFNSIFSFITVIYVILFVSHQFLYKINTKRIASETDAKRGIEADFAQFKKDINPGLLFETLEALLVLMKKDADAAEQLCDHFSGVYRYILTTKREELVPFAEELEALKAEIGLLNRLPFRGLKLNRVEVRDNVLVVPGSLLVILERVVRSTIASESQWLEIDILENDHTVELRYKPEETILENFDTATLEDIAKNYGYYSNTPLNVLTKGAYKQIEIPKLSLNESSHY